MYYSLILLLCTLYFKENCKRVGMKKILTLLTVVIISLTILHGCETEKKELINLAIVKEKLKEYHTGGKYNTDLNRIIKKAITEFSKITPKENSLVIFDIDETALSNYQFALDYDFGYNEEIWTEWVDSKKATAISEVKILYDMLIEKGFKVVFLTGRNRSHYDATKENLINEGYTKFDTLITRKMDALKTTAVDYKSKERKQLVENGYIIVGTIGDQLSDLEGPYHGIQVKLPNYYYIVK